MQADKHHKKHPHMEEPLDSQPGVPAEDAEAAAAATVSQDAYDALMANTEALREEAEALKAKAAENLDGWQRERADFMNYRKRSERDQASLRENITAAVVKKYLVILDDLERALRNRPSGGEGAAWAEGVELIYRKLQGILDAEGIQRMPAENQMFDPAMHEAILQEENPAFESGQITEVLQQGYTLGDRVIRPAQVKVAR